MRNFKTILGALVIGGAIAAGGSAFTAGNTLPAADQVKGYGSQTISGVTATSVVYNTDATGATIQSVGLVLTGDTTTKTIKIAFNDEAPATCSAAGVFTTTTAYTCVITDRPVSGVTKFAVVAVT